MSLLHALRSKKQLLKRTETVVTHADGRRFIENKDEIIAVADRSYGFVIDDKPDNVPAKITNNIYLGSQDCCESSVLTSYNITKVLSVGIQPAFTFPGITYKFVECLDLPETNIIDLLKVHCVPFIRNAISGGERILVHCNAGVSRSSAIVIGFLMLENSLQYNVAYDIVKDVRCSIKPNFGFEKQLKNWQLPL